MSSCKVSAVLLVALLALCGEALGTSAARNGDTTATLPGTAAHGNANRKLLQAAAAAASGGDSAAAAAASAISNLGYSPQVFGNWYGYYIQHGFGTAAAAAAGGAAAWAQHIGIPTNSNPFFNITNAAANGWLFGGASGAASGAAAAAASEGFGSSSQSAAAAAAADGGSAASAASGGGGAAAAAAGR